MKLPAFAGSTCKKYKQGFQSRQTTEATVLNNANAKANATISASKSKGNVLLK